MPTKNASKTTPHVTLIVKVYPESDRPDVVFRWVMPADEATKDRLASKAGVVLAALRTGRYSDELMQGLLINEDEATMKLLVDKAEYFEGVFNRLADSQMGPVVAANEVFGGSYDERG